MAELKFSQEIVDKITTAIKAGVHPNTAARFAGITKRTFLRWLENYPEFAADCEEAEATFEVRNVGAIQAASKNRWVAAAWLLERRYPERWGRVDRVEVYQIQKQAEALVDEFKAEGIDISMDDLMREREMLAKRSPRALPEPQQVA